MTRSTAEQLAAYQANYRHLAEQISQIGFIASGSVIQRRTRCGTPGCHCHDDPPQLHGPYWQWTAKIGGKTITRRLNDTEAQLYQQWIANDRKLRDLINQMRHIASAATELITNEATDTDIKV